MYLVKTEVNESSIEGMGVFTLEDIQKGTVVWQFDPSHDKTMSTTEFDALDADAQESLRRIAYLSQSTSRWVYPPENDPALYTNHSKDNNLSVLMDTNVSEEPLFVANRNITAGEELTNNYVEFDDPEETKKIDWLQ